MNGIILKCIGGFYYVETTDGIIECKARGIFRKSELSPSAGDKVEISISETGIGLIENVSERKNFFVRPPIANLDNLFFVVSVCDPSPSYNVLDTLIAVCEYKKINPVVVVTKNDIINSSEVYDSYKLAGFDVFNINYTGGYQLSLDGIKSMFDRKISAFVGNSGVGKSTLLNHLVPELALKTADVSKKLGRGRHTTREVELFSAYGGYIADTPGFSSVDIMRYEIIYKDELAGCFREFEKYIGQCQFKDCRHVGEKGCAVKYAMENGEIPKSRYKSYLEMYNSAKNIKEWEYRK